MRPASERGRERVAGYASADGGASVVPLNPEDPAGDGKITLLIPSPAAGPKNLSVSCR